MEQVSGEEYIVNKEEEEENGEEDSIYCKCFITHYGPLCVPIASELQLNSFSFHHKSNSHSLLPRHGALLESIA